MKFFKASLIVPVLIASCTGSSRMNTADVEGLKDVLIQTDKDFSRMSIEKGMRQAFIAYAAEDVIKLQDGGHPIIGIEALKAALPEKPRRPFTLEWLPLKADVARSGDLGYTFGNWVLRARTPEGADTNLYGNYVSIWRRQADGTWKYVLDGGNSTPPPK